ncbi:MAG: S41 family peptidase [Candidatus Omnitrophota bacterium]
MHWKIKNVVVALVCVSNVFSCSVFAAGTGSVVSGTPAHLKYLAYFEEVYHLMQAHYYFEVRQEDFDRFLTVFDTKIYPNIMLERKSSDYVRWRSSAYLVDALKQPDDIFSRYLPPKPAKQFAQEVYGKKVDLGIEGHLIEKGYLVDFIEPRSDAFGKGLRSNDLILNIDQDSVLSLDEGRVRDRLNPLEGSRVVIDFLSGISMSPHVIEVVSKEYFKQAVFERPTGVPGIYCLQIQKFNQGTPDDFSRLLGDISVRHPKGLVLDLRGNPGGPPLAARAISAFFLPNGDPLVYFEGRTRPRSALDIPVLPPGYRVDWPMAVLVNKGTGSAAELFSGVLQDRKRAIVLGEKTAGQVLLKSMFDLSDGSQMAMVNARGHFPDGRPFPFDGVRPNEVLSSDQEGDAIGLAAKYLYLKTEGKL